MNFKKIYSEYSQYFAVHRGSVGLDGLKPVQRRILYVLYNLTGKSGKFIKTARLVGEVMGKYHPHGDAGISDAVATMVSQKLIVGQGNWGNIYTIERIPPAAPRYTEVTWDKTLDAHMKYIEDVEYSPTKIDSSMKEPELLPVLYPLCLENRIPFCNASLVQGLSPGVRSVYPQFKKEDIINFVLSDFKDNTINPYFGNNVKLAGSFDISSSTNELKIFPCFTIEEKKKSIYLKAIVKKVIFDKVSRIIDLSKSDGTNILIECKSKEQLKEIKSKLENTWTKIKFTTYVSDKGIIYIISIKDWLKATYIKYKQYKLRNFNKKKEKIEKTLETYKLINSLKPIIKKSLSQKNPYQFLLNQTTLDKKAVESIINTVSIKKLLIVERLIDESESELNETKRKIKAIDSETKKDYEEQLKL